MTNIVKSNVTTKVVRPSVTPKVTHHNQLYPVSTGDGELDTSRFRYNQTPVETPDGATVTFTLPNSDSFTSGLIEVFVNGNQKLKGTEWQETGTTQITFIGSLATTPPESDESITLNYIKPA